jgi:hypothetical protein
LCGVYLHIRFCIWLDIGHLVQPTVLPTVRGTHLGRRRQIKLTNRPQTRVEDWSLRSLAGTEKTDEQRQAKGVHSFHEFLHWMAAFDTRTEDDPRSIGLGARPVNEFRRSHPAEHFS